MAFRELNSTEKALVLALIEPELTGPDLRHDAVLEEFRIDELDSTERSVAFRFRSVGRARPLQTSIPFARVSGTAQSVGGGEAKVILAMKFARPSYLSIADVGDGPLSPLSELTIDASTVSAEPFPALGQRDTVETEARKLRNDERALLERGLKEGRGDDTILLDQLDSVVVAGVVSSPGRMTVGLAVTDTESPPASSSAPIEAMWELREGNQLVTISLAGGFLSEFDIYQPGNEAPIADLPLLETLDFWASPDVRRE